MILFLSVDDYYDDLQNLDLIFLSNKGNLLIPKDDSDAFRETV